jgi:hypothetical protein
MEIVLDRLCYSGIEAAKLIIDHLRDALYHMTSLKAFQGITQYGAIRPNDGTADFSFLQSDRSNCFDLKAVSLWDFESPGEDVIYNDLTLDKCSTVLLHHQPAVFIGFHQDRLAPNLCYYSEIKQRLGYGGIIPRVEVCHIGAIRLALATHVVVTRLHNDRLRIQNNQGWPLSTQELNRINANED